MRYNPPYRRRVLCACIRLINRVMRKIYIIPMLKRAIRSGFQAAHLLADSWFSSKENIAAGIDAGLTVIMMMKRGNLN